MSQATTTRPAPEAATGAPEQPIDALGHVWRLAQATVPAQEFLRQLLPCVVDALGAVAGTVWVQEQNELRLTFKLDVTGGFLPEQGAAGESEWQVRFLIQQVQECFAAKRPVTKSFSPDASSAPGAGAPLSFSVPLLIDEKPVGVLQALKPWDGAQQSLRTDYFLLESLAGYFQLYAVNARLRQSDTDKKRLVAILELSKGTFRHLDVERVAFAIVNKARELVTCDRCSVALKKGNKYRIAAVSGRDTWDKRSDAILRLTAAMQCVAENDQKVYVTNGNANDLKTSADVIHTLSEYLADSPTKSLAVFPIKDEQGLVGAWAFESVKPSAYTAEDVGVISVLTDLSGVAVRNAQEYGRLPLAKATKVASAAKKKLVGQGNWKVKIFTALGITLFVAMFFPFRFRVTGKCKIAPVERRVCMTRVDGILREVKLHEGDYVTTGQLLARLDSTDFELALREAQKNLDMATIATDIMRGEGKTAEYKMKETEAEKIRAEIAQLERKIEFTQILAPISGVIISKDIDSAIGNPIPKGQLIYEIAPLSPVRVEVGVPEGKVTHVKAGAGAEFALSAFPERQYAFTCETLRQAAEVIEAENVFMAEGPIDNPHGHFKLGMAGIAKIDCGRRSLGYILFIDIVNFFRMQLWF
ncbi:MAG: HlyD family efflux transporter periplasmic adaptor subunit [Planctomycetes bacterium]|nr:HlyD family efflux transporter periplasmic adaptor subunit [Planctomycetota bacterium]